MLLGVLMAAMLFENAWWKKSVKIGKSVKSYFIGAHYQGWPLALMQNRPGGEEVDCWSWWSWCWRWWWYWLAENVNSLRDVNMAEWKRGFHIWLLYLSEYETWQVVKDYKGSKREDTSLVNCKIRIRGVPKSLPVATPHDPTYWNTQVSSKSYCASSKCHIRLSANTAQSLLWN